jgi:polysaccharide pyruvyl transferase WcaK-like protein
MKLCLYDPGIEDAQGTPAGNLGNLIIQEAVNREVNRLFSGWEIIRVSTFQNPGPELRRHLRTCDLALAGGTNLLTSEADKYRQWVISLRHILGCRRALLLGVGWWTYQGRPNLYTRLFYKLLLAGRGLHSVRDGYTADMLRGIGYRHVLNTACVTMWPLAERRPEDFPDRAADELLLMLTDYAPAVEADRRLIGLLREHYRRIHVWPQGKFDLDYLKHFADLPLQVLDRSYAALNAFLRTGPSCDYVGTRLHGGIHCLNHGRRALILEVDNRAREIARDTGLPTAPREDLEAVRRWILAPPPIRLHLPVAEIERWRAQFAPRVAVP